MPQHIGIVACSAEGAALCYRTICLEGAELLGPHNHPEVSLHNYPLAEYLKFITIGDWAGVAELMMSSAEKLISSPIARRGPGCTLRKRWPRRPGAAVSKGWECSGRVP